jgi:hypothetical protein
LEQKTKIILISEGDAKQLIPNIKIQTSPIKKKNWEEEEE